MPQTATLYRMLIASPGDCSEERNVIPRLVADWNASHSLHTSVILEPVLWETHSHPELGERTQEVINRQIVDTCDFVVGVFWTRLGTHTGVAPSGTAEELERFRASGKQVLLYFSTAPISPHLIDFKQYQALHEYRKQVEVTGLTFRYAGLHDFERLFSRHLARLMVTLTTASAPGAPKTENLAQNLAAVAPAVTPHGTMEVALQNLRTKTRYFWAELIELPTHRNEFTAEMKKDTYESVKPSLDHLASLGHLTYEAEYFYDTITNKSPVLNVKVQNVTTQLKNSAKQIANQASS